MAAGGVIAYEDIFEILDQDADGKRFDRVSRFRCRSAFESDLQIDINIDIDLNYPLFLFHKYFYFVSIP